MSEPTKIKILSIAVREDLTEKEVWDLIIKSLEYYARNHPKERIKAKEIANELRRYHKGE